MAAVFTEFLLISIMVILGLAKLIDDHLKDKLDLTNSELYGSIFTIIGLLTLFSTPIIFLELDSPLYTIATFLLGLTAFLLGRTESKTGRINSLQSITMISLFTIITYFLAVFISPIRRFLIETVTSHTSHILSRLYEVQIMEGPVYGYMSQIVFTRTDPTLITYIDIACTGIGSIVLVWGIISVFQTTVSRRVVYMLLSAIIIYILNMIRNVFIAIAFVEQWFSHPLLQKLALVSGASDDKLVSFVVAETFISQFISAFLLFIGLYLVVTYTSLLERFFSELEEDIETTYEYTRDKFD